MTAVAMTRTSPAYATGPPPCTEPGSPVTQNRTFVYDGAGRLTSGRILLDSDHPFSSDSDHPFSPEADQRSPVKPIAVLF